MGAEDSIQSFVAGFAGFGEFVANIVCQCVGFVVDLLLGNSQDLTEIALNRCLNRAVALDGLQMPCTQYDQGCGWQDYGQLKNQHQPGPRIRKPFYFHPGLLIRAFAWISPALTIVRQDRVGVNPP
jgi:hypothetical protein